MESSSCEVEPAQFYTGLVAELYEPLRSMKFTADQYAPFIDKAGQPALELGCGSGDPMLDLVQRGYDLDGLDSSEDMLGRCRARATARGLSVRLYRQEMQAMSLPRRYRAIFLAGATFTLLTDDAQARAALTAIHDHLVDGGRALIPLAGSHKVGMLQGHPRAQAR
jgi:cyclopropane fatty-acyl-phospholipid synthase-like methyltransferase